MQTFRFTKEDFISLGKGLIVALIGATATYLLTFVQGHDFGIWTPVIVALCSLIANIIRKSIDGPVQKRFGISL